MLQLRLRNLSNIIFIVYLAKLYEIILALILALISKHDKTYVFICIDNQTTIKAIENPRNSLEQYIVKSIIKFINLLRKKELKIELH